MKTKVYIILFVSLLLSLVFSFSSSAQEDYFIDNSEELQSLEDAFEGKLRALSEQYGIDFLIYAYEFSSYGTQYGDYKEDSEILNEFNLSLNADCILLVLEKYSYTGEWHCFLSTYGRGYDVISDREVEYLMRDGGIMDYTLSSDIHQMSDGIGRYLEYIEKATIKDAVPLYTRLWIPILLGALGALIAFLSVFISYKRKVRSDTYPLKEFTNMDLTYSDDQFTGTTVTRRHVPRSSGSSRSGGGGGSRGGRRGGR